MTEIEYAPACGDYEAAEQAELHNEELLLEQLYFEANRQALLERFFDMIDSDPSPQLRQLAKEWESELKAALVEEKSTAQQQELELV